MESDFGKYLMSKEIKVIDVLPQNNKIAFDTNQLFDLISFTTKFHKYTCDNDGVYFSSLKNKNGKFLEKLFVETRIFERNLTAHGGNLYYENSITKAALQIAKSIHNEIEAIDYLKLLKRSMNRKEICIGKVLHKSLIHEQALVAKNLKKCNYDMIETDIINILYYAKKLKLKIQIDKLVHNICFDEGLCTTSEKYINLASKYPTELIRFYNVNMRLNNEFTEDKFMTLTKFNKKLHKLAIKDKIY